ncbi:MAG: hypothetical protein RSA29_12265 [Clostridium sp.]|uniref:hypothetical protein n=1 Tax=Clostridium sp. TaxID=1506 RepID=UPI00302A6D5B
MKKSESKNYIFNYNMGSNAEKDIEEIIKLQETCHEYICNYLDVKMVSKINYYLCNSPEEVGEIYGDNEPCNGFASEPDKVYAVYNDKVKCTGFHEDAHVISYNTLGIPPQTFIREGLAMFFDKGYWGVPNYSWVNFFINRGLYVNIGELINKEGFYKHNHIITYTIAGAFVAYIIDIFGVNKFKEFYSSLDNEFEDRFLGKFKISLDELEKKFIDYIKVLKTNDQVEEFIRNSLIQMKVIKIEEI